MKAHPQKTVAMLVQMIKDKRPISAAEVRMRQDAISGHLRMMCVGCDAFIEPKDAAICICDGFVCAACVRVEDDGECNHDPIDVSGDMHV